MDDPLNQPEPQIKAIFNWVTNADLILATHKLGYIKDSDLVLDATYGRGVWWKKYRPPRLITNDLGKGHPDIRFDFRDAPFPDNTFDVVAYDPPYKLNGTPSTDEVDERYGVEVPTRWQDRIRLMIDGLHECARITSKGGIVLAKCQDQVSSGKVRWQTFIMKEEADKCGLDLDDMLFMTGGRDQPADRRQVHARRNYSTLMIFRKK